MPVLLLAFAILLSTAAPFAQQAEIPAAVRAAADRITAEQLKRDLDYLSSDELKGRNTPSPGFDKAADFIVEAAAEAPASNRWATKTRSTSATRCTIRRSTPQRRLEIDGKRFASAIDFVLRSLAGADFRCVCGRLCRARVEVDPSSRSIPMPVSTSRASWCWRMVRARCPRASRFRSSGASMSAASNVVAEAARRGAAGVVFIPQRRHRRAGNAMRGANLPASRARAQRAVGLRGGAGHIV